MSEKVLAVPVNKLFGNNGYFQGFMPAGKASFMKEIKNNYKFLLRSGTSENQKIPAESDPSHKQIIPYIVLKCRKKIFVYKRSTETDEKRLHSKYSLGIGGHINEVDTDGKDVILEALKREMDEELEINFKYTPKVIGYINDDFNDVGKVHFGVVFLIECRSDDVHVREKDKLSGSFIDVRQIEKIKNDFENWSKIVYDSIRMN